MPRDQGRLFTDHGGILGYYENQIICDITIYQYILTIISFATAKAIYYIVYITAIC